MVVFNYQKKLVKVEKLDLTLLTSTCSKSTIETLEKDLKYVQS